MKALRNILTAVALLCGATILHAQQAPPAPPPNVPATLAKQPLARISGGVMAGNLLTKVNPVYPPDAKAARVSGTVVLHAVISKDGTVEALNVISGPQLLRDASVDAVKQWVYKPYLLNGEPVEVDTTIVVNFHLATPPPSN